MILQHITALLLALSTPALAEPLSTVLQQNGLSEFARQIQANGAASIDGKTDLVIYAPTDAALLAAGNVSGFISPVAENNNKKNENKYKHRRATPEEIRTSRLLMHYCTQTPPPPRPPPPPPTQQSQNRTRRLLRMIRGVGSGDSALVSLLDNPEFSNLGPGNNQVIVQRRTNSSSSSSSNSSFSSSYSLNSSSSQTLVFSGMGRTARVVGADIPFDQGVVRPISEFLALPGSISETLPLIGGGSGGSTNKFRQALLREGNGSFLADIEARPAITVLAPVDAAFTSGGNDNGGNGGNADMLRRHVLVDFPAYTPLLRDGDVYPTLAGGRVTVSVRAGGVVYLNGARIVAGDAMTRNGLIHVIDKVLDTSSPPPPPSPSPPPYTAAAVVVGLPSWEAMVCSFAFAMGVARWVGLLLP